MDARDFDVEYSNMYVSKILEFIENGRIILTRVSNWDNYTKSLFIETLLLRITTSPVCMDFSSEKFEILIGEEKIQTINEFISGNLKLEGLEVMSELNGLDSNSFPKNLYRRIIETNLPINKVRGPIDNLVKENLIKHLSL